MEARSAKNVPRITEEEENDLELIKRRISCHPLFAPLTEAHLNCLKASLGEMEEVGTATEFIQTKQNITTNEPKHSDLDHFMEAYCMALRDLKETIAEPLQDTTSFVDAMHFQLNELMTTYSHTPSATSSGEDTAGGLSRGHCLNRRQNDQLIHSSGSTSSI